MKKQNEKYIKICDYKKLFFFRLSTDVTAIHFRLFFRQLMLPWQHFLAD